MGVDIKSSSVLKTGCAKTGEQRLLLFMRLAGRGGIVTYTITVYEACWNRRNSHLPVYY